MPRHASFLLLPELLLLLSSLVFLTDAESSSSKITFTITGQLSVNSSSTEISVLNLTVWDSYPVSMSDTVYYDVTSFLNTVLLTGAGASTPAPTSTPVPGQEEGWSWWMYLLVGLGSVIGLVALVLAIYFAVKSRQQAAASGYEHLPPPPPGDACRVGTQHHYPPPHANSKVIQIPLMHPRSPASTYTVQAVMA